MCESPGTSKSITVRLAGPGPGVSLSEFHIGGSPDVKTGAWDKAGLQGPGSPVALPGETLDVNGSLNLSSSAETHLHSQINPEDRLGQTLI